VVVLLPAQAKAWQILRTKYRINPVLTSEIGRGGTLAVEHSDPRVAPPNPAAFNSANAALASFPTDATPALGSLQGKGFYVSKLAYELKGASASAQHAVFSTFVGLVASEGVFRAWMSGLWTGEYQQILQGWGKATNVVIADGVDQGGFAAAVISRNGH
jgi:hypothetical protein